MEQVISSADPAIAFIGFLQTMQALPERPLSQPRVFVSHRMAYVPYAERFDCLRSSAVLSSACRFPCYVGYNGSFQAGSKPPEMAASWTVWNVRTATPSTLRRTHQRAKGALTGCI